MDGGMRRGVNATQGLAFCSLKNLIKWADDLKVDQPNIDTQHERIFKLAVDACQLSRDVADIDRLRVAFDEFGAVLKAHFRYEEGKLAEISYPKLDEHRAEHAAMLAELEFINQRLESKGVGWAFQGEALVVLNFMLGVTIGHILQSDADYARYIHESATSGEGLQLATGV
jgi:hemerythrin